VADPDDRELEDLPAVVAPARERLVERFFSYAETRPLTPEQLYYVPHAGAGLADGQGVGKNKANC
jgi:hypothetical protein